MGNNGRNGRKNDNPHKKSGKPIPKELNPLEIKQRQIQAVKLRTAGVEYEQIANTLGFANKSGAFQAVKALLDRTETESADNLRKVSTQRLNNSLLEIRKVLTECEDPPMPGDEAPACAWQSYYGSLVKLKKLRLECVGRLVTVEKRRASLEGLDKPIKIAQTDKEGNDIDERGAEADTTLARIYAACNERLGGAGVQAGGNGDNREGQGPNGDDKPT